MQGGAEKGHVENERWFPVSSRAQDLVSKDSAWRQWLGHRELPQLPWALRAVEEMVFSACSVGVLMATGTGRRTCQMGRAISADRWPS